MEQKTKDWENERTQGSKKNPQIRLQLEGWAGVLESTGLYVPKEAVESVFTAMTEYDWIDSEVLGILNSLLESEGSEKMFYITWDGGQGVIVFFCNREWKEQFEKKTGLKLESC